MATAVAGEGIDVSGATGNVTISGEDATISNKGIASFSSDNFAVSSGAVTIKAGGVDLTAEVTGVLPIANFATKDEDNMSSNSDTHVPTQQSVKAYVDSVASGLDVKDSVRVATTASITIATALNNGDTLDGVTLADGNRVLVKNQSTASENGIYVVGASPARATDLASGDTAAAFFTFVEEGTANADIGYVCTSNAGADTVGTHSLAFAQFSSAGQVTAGTGIDKSGSEISVDVSDFMTNGANNRILTATGTDAMNAEANLTFDSPTLTLSASDPILKINDTGLAIAAPAANMAGLELITGGMNSSTNDYGTAIKFMSTDSAFTTENPKFLAAILPRATETYLGDSDGGMALDFAVTDDNPGTTNVPSVKMTVDHTGKVGIGTIFPEGGLHVVGSGSNDYVGLFQADDDGSSAAPDVGLFRNSTDPVNGDDIGHFRFLGKNKDASDNSLATHDFADMFAEMQTITKDAEDGKLHIRTIKAGSMDKRISISATETSFNEDSKDVNFRIESNDDSAMFFVDAGENRIGIGTILPQTDLEIRDTTASSATQGGGLRLSSNDGALMATGHRLGVIEFAGAEDGSGNMTVGGRIEVLCNGAWSGSANAADMIFYTTTGNATQGEVMRLLNDKSITAQGGITIQTGASSGQKALYLRHQDADVVALDIATDNTTAKVVNIQANDFTTATVFNIDAGGLGSMTTGKVIDAKGTYTIADGGTVNSNRLYTTLVGTATQTNTGSLSYVKKTGATASGKTSTVTALEAWSNDAATNNASGTSIARGVYGKASFATSNQGTTFTFGGVFEVSGADNNYGVQIIGGSLLLETLANAPADISTYGQLWVKDEGGGSSNTELYFTNDSGDDIRLTFGGSSRRPITAGGNTLDQAETLAFTAGSNIAISESGGAVTIAATGTISGGITVQEEGSALSNLGDTLNFVGSSVTATGTGTTKTITISGGGAFARSTNIIKTTENIGVGGSNAEEFALSDGGAVNSEAIMANNGTNGSVTTHGMGMRKNVTIVVPDADTGEDTYTVADTDHIIMLCNVKPSNSTTVAGAVHKIVQLPAIGSTYVGREITVTLHALSGSHLDNINVKPASDDVILYHGRMWDNNQTPGNHNDYASALGGLGMTMGHAAYTDLNWAILGQVSVISVTMIAVDHGRLSALLGGANPFANYVADTRGWDDGTGDTMTADVWLVTQVSGQSDLHSRLGLIGRHGEAGLSIDDVIPRIG